MKRVIAVLVLVALAAGGWYAWTEYERRGGAGGGDVTSGTVETDEVAVSALTQGRIVEAKVVEGQRVRKGDVLFRIDARVATNQLGQAQAAERAARVNYTQIRDDDDSTDAEIAEANAKLDQARLAVETAKVLVGYANVTAPVDGVIASLAGDVGEIASPGATLAVISDPTDLEVSVFVPETEIGNVKVGDAASLTTDSSSERFSGKVAFIATDAEYTPANIETKDQRVKLVYEVRLTVADDSGTLKPGMPVDVAF